MANSNPDANYAAYCESCGVPVDQAPVVTPQSSAVASPTVNPSRNGGSEEDGAALPSRWIKKREEVTAYQITRRLLETVLFDGGEYPKGLSCACAAYHPERREIHRWRGKVTNSNGLEFYVEQGDWIIADPDGEHFSACSSEVFTENYEPAAAEAADVR